MQSKMNFFKVKNKHGHQDEADGVAIVHAMQSMQVKENKLPPGMAAQNCAGD